MSNLVQQNAIENALIKGDLSMLKPEERLAYYKKVCDSVGLNPLTKPFEYIQLNGKLVLYATRAATDQLRSVHKVSIKITAREKFDDIYVVTAQATNSDGRFDESTGAVNIAGLRGDSLANAYLKAETKAKRRVTLSLCGLGLLDESEIETISDAKPFEESQVNTKTAIEGHKTEQKNEAKKLDEPLDFENYIIELGPKNKMTGSKLQDHTDDWLRKNISSQIDWYRKENKKPHPNATKFIEMAEAYLKHNFEIQKKNGFDPNEKMPE